MLRDRVLTRQHLQNVAVGAVDVALVLAVDSSGSIGNEDLALQFQGYAQAITSDVLMNAVRSGRHGRIALTFVAWSSAGLVPWMLIDVSGDGVNNDGRSGTEARDEAIAAGIAINGLPIVRDEPDIAAYYSYIFHTAVLEKFVTEIAQVGTQGRS